MRRGKSAERIILIMPLTDIYFSPPNSGYFEYKQKRAKTKDGKRKEKIRKRKKKQYNTLKKENGEVGNRTLDLSHAKRSLYP